MGYSQDGFKKNHKHYPQLQGVAQADNRTQTAKRSRQENIVFFITGKYFESIQQTF